MIVLGVSDPRIVMPGLLASLPGTLQTYINSAITLARAAGNNPPPGGMPPSGGGPGAMGPGAMGPGMGPGGPGMGGRPGGRGMGPGGPGMPGRRAGAAQVPVDLADPVDLEPADPAGTVTAASPPMPWSS